MRIILYFLFVTAIVSTANAQQLSDDFKSDVQKPLIYVVGKVKKPAKIAFTEALSLSQAIYQAGGVMLNGRKSRAVITRRPADCKYLTKITIDLKDILARRTEDIILQPNDVVEIQVGKVKNNKVSDILRPCVSADKTANPSVYYNL